MSGVFAKPAFQAQTRTPQPTPGIWIGGANDPERFDGRWIPDVAANAHSDSGYKIILGGERFMAHESSAAAPLWAGLIALLAQGYGKPLPWMPELLYSPGYAQALNDITQGDNKLGDSDEARCFDAGTGWDACTGLGSPNGAALLAALTK